MMENMLANNWIAALSPTMQKNGCKASINTPADVISNLYYLSKESFDGGRYIPFHELRIVEKLVCGMFNTGFEYEDKTDVYIEKIGDVLICYANVRYVHYLADGSKRIISHGFNAKSLESVRVPGNFTPSIDEKVSVWKAQTIGGAKSRALFEAGFGIEYYGDLITKIEDDEPLAESKEDSTNDDKSYPNPQKKESDYSENGMPVPQPKRQSKKAAETKTSRKESVEIDTIKTEVKETPKEMTLEEAKSIVADCGNYAGMTLESVYETAPKNLVFLARNSSTPNVANAAKLIIHSDVELAERFAI